MLKKILLGVVVLFVLAIGGFAVVVALQPNEMRVTRSAALNAPPAAVFAQVNDLQAWEAWSPWAKLDPNAKNTFEGPKAGKGAVFHWAGNQEVGEGEMTIIESTPNELIRLRLHFIKPFEDTSTVEFTFQPEGEQTRVSWSMFGPHTFMSKAMCLLMGVEKQLGASLEEGLANIKKRVEDAKTATP